MRIELSGKQALVTGSALRVEGGIVESIAWRPIHREK